MMPLDGFQSGPPGGEMPARRWRWQDWRCFLRPVGQQESPELHRQHPKPSENQVTRAATKVSRKPANTAVASVPGGRSTWRRGYLWDQLYLVGQRAAPYVVRQRRY